MKKSFINTLMKFKLNRISYFNFFKKLKTKKTKIDVKKKVIIFLI